MSSIPHSPEAEAQYVGAMLLTPAHIADALAVAGPDDFYVPRLRDAYRVMVDMHGQGDAITPTTVAAHLPSLNGEAKRFLSELLIGCEAQAAWPTHARRIAALAHHRRLLAANHELTRALRAGEGVEEALATVAGVAAVGDTSASAWGQEENIAAVLATIDVDDAPTMLKRTDGVALIYPGKNHSFHGETETGKSWVGVLVCAERIEAGEHALYMDFEDNARDVVGRLLALGVDPEAAEQHFHYQRIDEPMGRAGAAAHDKLLAQLAPSVVIIDGVTEALVLHGWSLKDNEDVARFIRDVPRRINRHGAATAMIDHVGRDREARGRFAIGAQHKLAGLDGAAYTFETVEPFGRGRHGIARITVAKDRPGHVRRHADRYGRIGEFHLAADSDGTVTIAALRPPAAAGAAFRPTALMEKISRYLEVQAAPQSQTSIEAAIPNKVAYVRKALQTLIEEGHVDVEEGARNARLHRSARRYREDEDNPE